jgi:hypothetical protein
MLLLPLPLSFPVPHDLTEGSPPPVTAGRRPRPPSHLLNPPNWIPHPTRYVLDQTRAKTEAGIAISRFSGEVPLRAAA